MVRKVCSKRGAAPREWCDRDQVRLATIDFPVGLLFFSVFGAARVAWATGSDGSKLEGETASRWSAFFPPWGEPWQSLQAAPAHYAGKEGRFDWCRAEVFEASREMPSVLGF
jgi:hypothetical protein